MSKSRSSSCSLCSLCSLGALALSLSHAVPGSADRLEQERAVHDACSETPERLDDQEAWVRATEAWRRRHTEARRGYVAADEWVIDSGWLMGSYEQG